MCRPPPAANPAPHAVHAPLRREGVAAGRAGESWWAQQRRQLSLAQVREGVRG